MRAHPAVQVMCLTLSIMSTKELQQKVAKAIEGLSDKALVKLIALVGRVERQDHRLRVGRGALIEQLIEENRDVLARLAK